MTDDFIITIDGAELREAADRLNARIAARDSAYRVERLANGLVRVTDRASGLRGLYHHSGAYRSGDLRNVPAATIVAALVSQPQPSWTHAEGAPMPTTTIDRSAVQALTGKLDTYAQQCREAALMARTEGDHSEAARLSGMASAYLVAANSVVALLLAAETA